MKNKSMNKLKIWLGGTDPKILWHPVTWLGFLGLFAIIWIVFKINPESPMITRLIGFLFISTAFLSFIRGISMVISKKIKIQGIYKQKKILAVFTGLLAIIFSSCCSLIGFYLLITGEGMQ